MSGFCDADIKMIYEALRFANWAAGQGICPVAGEPCEAPEEFLFEWSSATDREDWDEMPEAFRALLVTLSQEPQPSTEEER